MTGGRAYRVLLLPGDGIGPEVVAEARRVLEAAAARFGFAVHFEEALLGGAAIEASGDPLPAETLAAARDADAVLMGAVGGPRWDDLPGHRRPEGGLLRLRKALGVFANLRPARALACLAAASPLRAEVAAGVDLLVVRELTGGLYFGEPRERRRGADGRWVAVDTLVYSEGEIERILRVAFEVARSRRRRVTSVDKANVLESSRLWREVAERVGRAYPDVALSHMLVDTCAMQLVRNPAQFDVVVTENLFGDILSDEAAVLTGSLGMLPSASLAALPGPGRGPVHGLYEPVHGSAPDIAGQDRANPCAAILSGALMLRYSFGLPDAAAAVEAAVTRVLEQGWRTADLAGSGGEERVVGTSEMGWRIAREVEAA